MENENAKVFYPKRVAMELLELIKPKLPNEDDMQEYEPDEYCAGCTEAINRFIEMPIVTLFEPINVARIDLFIGLNSHQNDEDSRLSIELLKKKREIFINIQTLAQERFTQDLNLPNLKWQNEHRHIKQENLNEFESLVQDTFSDYAIYIERIKATFKAIDDELEARYNESFDKYEKERIAKDYAQSKAIEAQLEAQVESEYEDFLDAQKYNPNLRA